MFEKISSLDRSLRAAAAAHAAALGQIADLDAEHAWERDGATSMSAWLAGRFGLTRATGVEWVRVARALRSLPAIHRRVPRGTAFLGSAPAAHEVRCTGYRRAV